MRVPSPVAASFALVFGCASAAGPAAGAVAEPAGRAAEATGGTEATRGPEATPSAPASPLTLPFPSEERVAALVADAAEPGALAAERAVVPFPWRLEAVPMDPRRTPHERRSFPGRMLAALLASEGESPLPELAATEGMRCVAQAEARVFLTEGKAPAPVYEEFALARCGVPADGVRAAGIAFDLPRGGSLSSLGAADRAQVLRRLRGTLVELGAGEVGLALAEGDVAPGRRRAFLALAHARPRVRTPTPRPQANSRGRVEISGEVLGAAPHWIAGAINQGEAGVASCEADPGLALPRFRLRCQLAPGDPYARVSVTAGEGTLLAERVASFVARRPGADVRGPVPARSTSRALEDGGDLGAYTVAAFNRVRSGAGLVPLVLSAPESDRLDGLVRAAVDPRFGGDAGDELSLAIVAGSAIEDAPPLRDGAYVGTLMLGPPNTAAWLTACFLDPDMRRLFLAPAARVAAIGAEVTPRGLAALTATWQTHGDPLVEDAAADVVVSAVQRARLARRLPAAQPIRGYAGLGPALDRVRTGAATRQEALDAVLAEALGELGGTLEAFSIRTLDLRALDLPAALLQEGPLDLAVEVTHQRAEGSTWGTYIVGVLTRRP